MTENQISYQQIPIQPLDCLVQGYHLIKDQYWLILGITFVGLLIGGVFPLVLLGPCYSGIYLCLFKKSKNQAIQFDNLFKGFDYFVESLIATLVQAGFVILVLIPLILLLVILVIALGTSAFDMQSGQLSPDLAPMQWLPLLAIIIVGTVIFLALHALMVFSYPLIVEYNLKGWSAVKTSFKAAWPNIGGLIGLALLSGLLSLLGLCLCYVGAVLVAPITFAAWVIAFNKIFSRTPQLSQ